MSDKAPTKKNNLFKIAMIPVLGALLFWVVNKNQKSDDVSASGFEKTKQSASDAAIVKPKHREIVWPELAIDDLLKHNPFTTGIQIANRDRLDNEGGAVPPSQTQQIEISVYMESKKGPVAMIDGQIVHEGDRLANGQFITKLTPEYAILGKQL